MFYKDGQAGNFITCEKCGKKYQGGLGPCPFCGPEVNKMDLVWAVLKAMKPHRQKVLPAGADKHLKLQSWANKQAFSEKLLGDEAKARRDALMREAVTDPEKHGLRFVDGPPIPFDDSPPAGQAPAVPAVPAVPAENSKGQMSLDDF